MQQLTWVVLLTLLSALPAHAQLLVSGNEGKYDLSSGVGRAVKDAPPDSLSILDFAVFPPRVRHLSGVSNSVIGPPSNVAITPDEHYALVANSVRRYTSDPKKPEPDDVLQIVSLAGDSPRVVGKVQVGKQPSGLSINSAGTLALVANRADGTVSVVSIDGANVKLRQTIEVGQVADEPSDVAINPAGTLAIVSLNKAGVVRVLRINDGRVEVAPRKLPVYGQPYHVQFTPDGTLGLVAGGGGQDGPDADLLTVVDLAADPIRTIDHIPLGTGPESFDISPDGQHLAVVLMNSSNVTPDQPQRTENGLLQLFKRDGKSFAKIQELPIGRIPEGACFTPDGKHLVVQEHAARQIAIYELSGDKLSDTKVRIATPGFPSSLRRVEHAE